MFLMIFNALNAPIERVQILFKHQKQWNPPLGFNLFEHLSVIVAIQLQLMNN
jgi:hypothetical protein